MIRRGQPSWDVDSVAERDGLGSVDGARVGDACLVRGEGWYTADTVGASSSTWIPAGNLDQFLDVYDVDFSSLANQSLSPDGTFTIDGLDWTTDNTADATSIDVVNGTGIVIVASATSVRILDGDETSPKMFLDLESEIFGGTNYQVGDIVRVSYAAEYAAMNTGNDTRVACGLRFGDQSGTFVNGNNSAVILNGDRGGGAGLLWQVTANSSSTSKAFNATPYADSDTTDDRTYIIEVDRARSVVSGWVGPAYSSSWPEPGDANVHPVFAHSLLSSNGQFEGDALQAFFAIQDLSTSTSPTVTLSRMRVQRTGVPR